MKNGLKRLIFAFQLIRTTSSTAMSPGMRLKYRARVFEEDLKQLKYILDIKPRENGKAVQVVSWKVLTGWEEESQMYRSMMVELPEPSEESQISNV